MNCPIEELTGDGEVVGRCYFYLPDGKTCPRHGNVEQEVSIFKDTGICTPENHMRHRKHWPLRLIPEKPLIGG